MYSCALSFTSALGVVGGHRHASAALLPGRTRYPLCRRRVGLRDGLDGYGKSGPPTGIRSPGPPARS